MSKFKEASENIKRLSSMFKGLIEIGEEMDKVESLENHIAELEQSKAQLLKLNGELQKENSNALDSINENEAKAKAIKQEADADAKNTIDDANSKAQSIVDSAKAEAEAMLSVAVKKVEQFHLDVDSAADELEKIKAQIVEESSKLEAIQNQLASIKGSI